MVGLVPTIHVFGSVRVVPERLSSASQDVDGRHKDDHDECGYVRCKCNDDVRWALPYSESL